MIIIYFDLFGCKTNIIENGKEIIYERSYPQLIVI